MVIPTTLTLFNAFVKCAILSKQIKFKIFLNSFIMVRIKIGCIKE